MNVDEKSLLALLAKAVVAAPSQARVDQVASRFTRKSQALKEAICYLEEAVSHVPRNRTLRAQIIVLENQARILQDEDDSTANEVGDALRWAISNID